MCAKSSPCDEFEWLAEFVDYQTSEHQSKVKYGQRHKAVVKRKLSPQTLFVFLSCPEAPRLFPLSPAFLRHREIS